MKSLVIFVLFGYLSALVAGFFNQHPLQPLLVWVLLILAMFLMVLGVRILTADPQRYKDLQAKKRVGKKLTGEEISSIIER